MGEVAQKSFLKSIIKNGTKQERLLINKKQRPFFLRREDNFANKRQIT